MGIMTELKKESANTNLTMTENGALGFTNHQSDIVDFFYKVSSMRTWSKDDKRIAFQKALAEDAELTYRMLFFVRDIRGGLGERQLFRDIFSSLDESTVLALLKLVPEYGRWDDVIDLLNTNVSDKVKEEIYALIFQTLSDDLVNMDNGKSVSLLAKWMPSIRNVAKDKVKLAKSLCMKWRWTEKEYRKTLSKLRGYIKVVEKDMTSGQWDKIDFGSVPSKAAKNYREAFKKHQEERYNTYLEGLKKGTEKVNAGAVYPYEIVTSYRYSPSEDDTLLESQWKSLPLPKKGILSQAIVVRDGSGSMEAPVSGRTTALDVATSLAILMSENLKGEFKDRFITFSENPKFVDLGGCQNLKQKIRRCCHEAECANTDIEKTMGLILRTVVNNKIPQEEIPAVVIVSDMEFDEARGAVSWCWSGKRSFDSQGTLFAKIAKTWNDAGYELPKIVFWNVASRTGAVPMQENKNGLLLVSGFSQNILDMLSEGGTMLDVIRKKLMTKRYDIVAEALK